ncbi:MAG: DegT/DnrJ/EryC1/StrS family aminotransferase [Polyangiaceae bacterium]
MTIALFGGKPTIALASHQLWPEIGDDERAAVARVLDRNVLSGATAPECVALERELASYAGVKYALLTHSGTSALHLALAAAGISAGDHVLVPAYSFVATPLSVLHCGAIPLFVDVDEATGLIDPVAAAAAITPRTRAIMPVHVHGCAADMGPLLELAERHRLLVIEDAAQAHGATWNGRPVGSIGRAGGFSFQSSKNLGIGEGGAVLTNDDALAEEANSLRTFGQDVALSERDSFDVVRPLDGTRALQSGRIGWMYRGNELAAAIARTSLKKLPARTKLCQENAERLTRALAGLPGVSPPSVPRGSTSVHHKFRVRLDPVAAGVKLSPRVLRDAMIRALRAEGLEVVLWQTAPLSAQPVFQKLEGFGGGWPWSADRETDYRALYAPSRFPKTQALLDGSLILFSQSRPLIGQSRETVDAYAEAFARVWSHREELAAWALRETAQASKAGATA